jgi:hypothetical protein
MASADVAKTAMEWFYTAPIEDTAVRRGDPLGMRAIAEEMAEVLAPGLSNRTIDGRWISIMCWALEQSYSAWQAQGVVDDDGAIETPQAARELYGWLRPLEMLWLARTVKATGDRGKGRQLPGIRAVRRWLHEDVRGDRFGFDPSAYGRYRFTGIYGAYRVALRSLPGLTVRGDGWRLDALGRQLAEVVRGHVRCSQTHRRTKGRRPEPERYWERGFEWQRRGADCLPTVLAKPKRLPRPERDLLSRALFSSHEGSDTDRARGVRRRAVVEAAASSSATTRSELFADVARTLGGGKASDELALLSPFCDLADAGVAAMNACWTAVSEGNDTRTGFAQVSDVLRRSKVLAALDALVSAAERWQRQAITVHRPIPVADALAEGVLQAGDRRKRQLQAIERHHNRFGGGLKWLAIEGEVIKPLAPLRGGDASEYAFRIGALSRLGVQCAIIDEIPLALRVSEELKEEDEA